MDQVIELFHLPNDRLNCVHISKTEKTKLLTTARMSYEVPSNEWNNGILSRFPVDVRYKLGTLMLNNPQNISFK